MVAALWSGVAAAEPSALDKATAQSLFDEGRRLVSEGKFAAGCPKLAESQRLDAALGTLLRLADCYERNGQAASAWATFLEAEDAAKKARDDREKVARQRVDALAPKVSKLTVNVSAPETTGLELRRDGVRLERTVWGAALPMDAGSHALEATAPGRTKWSVTVEVPPGGVTTEITIPVLAPAPGEVAVVAPPPVAKPTPPPEPAKPPEAPRGESGSSRTAGWVVGGVGAAALATGVVLLVVARSKHDDAVGRCAPWCGDDARSLNDSAKSTGLVGGVVAGVGAVTMGVAGYLLFGRKGEASGSGLLLSPDVGPQHAGMRAGGAW